MPVDFGYGNGYDELSDGIRLLKNFMTDVI